MTLADQLINRVLESLELQNGTDEEKYNQMDNIVNALQEIHQATPINPVSTGTISERLCELGLRAAVPDLYKRIVDNWNWMADFSVYGHPFNLLISVKSFKAKERLIVSGSGNNLSPTVGWGLFDDAGEWTLDRTKKYLYRSFIAIYMPAALYNDVNQAVREIVNINGNPFIREIENFIEDLRTATRDNAIDVSSI